MYIYIYTYIHKEEKSGFESFTTSQPKIYTPTLNTTPNTQESQLDCESYLMCEQALEIPSLPLYFFFLSKLKLQLPLLEHLGNNLMQDSNTM